MEADSSATEKDSEDFNHLPERDGKGFGDLASEDTYQQEQKEGSPAVQIVGKMDVSVETRGGELFDTYNERGSIIKETLRASETGISSKKNPQRASEKAGR